MVKANVDKILDYLRVNKKASLGELSKKLGLPKKDLEKSAEYLEQDGVVKVDKGLSGTSIALIKDPEEKKSVSEIPEPPKIQQPEKPSEQLAPPPMPATPQSQTNKQQLPESPKMTSQQPEKPGQKSQIPPPPMKQEQQNQPLPPPPKPGNLEQTKQASEPDMPPPPLPNQKTQLKSETTPQIPKPDTAEAQQPAISKQSKEETQQPTKEKKPAFLLDEDSTYKPPEQQIQTQPQEPVMKSPPVQQMQPSLTDNADPLETPPPNFNMNTPDPVPRTRIQQPSQSIPQSQPPKQMGNLSGETPITQPKQSSKYHFPEYAQSTVDKIDYLIEQANKKIDMHDYDNVNVLYRRIYDMYQNSDDITPNERYFIGEKVKELFDRIKRVYIIEHVT